MSSWQGRPPFPKGEDGAVLILVLWVVALLSMIGGYFTLETTLRRNLGYGPWNLLKAQVAVDSVLNLIATHVRPLGQEDVVDSGDKFVVPDGSEYRIEIGGQELRFYLEDEQGKLDLNKAKDEELLDLFKGLLGADRGTVVAESIMDWRDNDDSARPEGAEDDYYAGLSPPYEPANGNFQLLEQLLLVKGVTPTLFWGPIKWRGEGAGESEAVWTGGIQDLVTVFNGKETMVEEAAPRPLVDLLDKEYFTHAQGVGTLRFKTCIYQSCYQIFFKKDSSAKAGYLLVHWQQIPRLETR